MKGGRRRRRPMVKWNVRFGGNSENWENVVIPYFSLKWKEGREKIRCERGQLHVLFMVENFQFFFLLSFFSKLLPLLAKNEKFSKCVFVPIFKLPNSASIVSLSSKYFMFVVLARCTIEHGRSGELEINFTENFLLRFLCCCSAVVLLFSGQTRQLLRRHCCCCCFPLSLSLCKM